MLVGVAVLIGATAVGQESVNKDLRRFTGAWAVRSVKVNGRELPKAETAQTDQVVYDGDGGWQQRSEGETVYAGVVTAIDAAATPKSIDYVVVKGGRESGRTVRAIYEFVDEDTYRICYSGPGGKRPADFSCKEGSGETVCVLKREKK
jgi:uncharacterized protein (TIGR03067 family)